MVGNFFPKKFINTFNSYYCYCSYFYIYNLFKFNKTIINNRRPLGRLFSFTCYLLFILFFLQQFMYLGCSVGDIDKSNHYCVGNKARYGNSRKGE